MTRTPIFRQCSLTRRVVRNVSIFAGTLIQSIPLLDTIACAPTLDATSCNTPFIGRFPMRPRRTTPMRPRRATPLHPLNLMSTLYGLSGDVKERRIHHLRYLSAWLIVYRGGYKGRGHKWPKRRRRSSRKGFSAGDTQPKSRDPIC